MLFFAINAGTVVDILFEDLSQSVLTILGTYLYKNVFL